MRRVYRTYVIPGVDHVHEQPLLLGLLLSLVVFRRGESATTKHPRLGLLECHSNLRASGAKFQITEKPARYDVSPSSRLRE
jgi:hypothetical protein